MEVYKILLEVINNPEAPKFYRDLQNFYKNEGMENESEAFLKLLEIKFKKNVSDN
jgi:hypothetical protein